MVLPLTKWGLVLKERNDLENITRLEVAGKGMQSTRNGPQSAFLLRVQGGSLFTTGRNACPMGLILQSIGCFILVTARGSEVFLANRQKQVPQ
jgi:hypothetical protein